MFYRGHLGVGLALCGLIRSRSARVLSWLLVWSFVPDLDSHTDFVPHRGPTHTFSFSIIAACVSYPFGKQYAYASWIGVIGHLMADVLNPMGVNFFGRNVSLNVCKASFQPANDGLLWVGITLIVSKLFNQNSEKDLLLNT